MPACPECGASLGSDHRFCPFDGTPIVGGRDAGSFIGKLVSDRYRVVGRLGEGGMATIYLARHEHLQRDVALKVLHPHLASEPKLLARFAREGRAASRIDHENVVYVLDFGRSEEGFFFLVMEHVVGRSLEEEISQCGRLSPARATHILAQIATAIGRAHELGIVHRDLKPDNVLLSRRGRDADFVKVLDFGLAKLVEPEPDGRRLTSLGEVFGTPEYMAPEQWHGQTADARTDIYALGVMAHQMLTGRMPFEGTGPMAQMLMHCNEPAPVPSETTPGRGIPAVFDDMVRTCLQKEPEDRYQSVDELLEVLGRAWAAVDPPSVAGAAATYAATVAAPPPRAPDSIPDPTVYRTAEMDVMLDGPGLYAEIEHLHHLRRRRAREVVQALWRGRPPDEVREIEGRIDDLERAVEQAGEEIAVLRALADEARRVAGEERAALRESVMDASLVVSGLNRLVDDDDDAPVEVVVDLDGETIRPPPAGDPLAETLGDGAPVQAAPPDDELGPASRLHRAERRLASFDRSHLRDLLELEDRLAEQLAALREAEGHLAPLYEKLAALVAEVAAHHPGTRAQVVAYEQVDGALASYKALLDAMDA